MDKGIVLSKGVGYGYAYNFDYDSEVPDVKNITLQDVINTVKEELANVYDDTEDISEEEAMIFDAHKTLLEDCTFINGIEELLASGMSLSQAIMENGKKNAFVFLNMEDKSLSHIAEDIMDITYQMVDVLKEQSSQMPIKEPMVLCCENIYPSTLLNFISNYKIAAILTKNTSELSHSAIIARSAGIPMITGLEFEVKNKMPVIVNTEENEVIFNPNYQKMMEIKRAPQKQKSSLNDMKIEIKANAGDLNEVLKISKSSDSSIGLFRSEYFYLKNSAMPTDEEVSDFVDEIFFSFNDRSMDYRLPDFGRDKLPEYLQNPDNLNGIEFLLYNSDILKQQINAIKNAKNPRNKRILLSYVKSGDVIDIVREMLSPSELELGAMVESILPDDILQDIVSKVDFINIGTNDLLCDFSGNDRNSYVNTESENISAMFDYIKRIVDIAHANNKKVCICGEIASDSEYYEQIMKSSVDSISVASFHILNK